MSDEPKRRGRPPKVRETAPDEREASNNRAEQGSAAGEVASPVADAAPVVAGVAAVGLADWIASIERDAPPILVAVTHPDAVDGVHNGKFSGIRMSHGPMAAYWSDGSKT